MEFNKKIINYTCEMLNIIKGPAFEGFKIDFNLDTVSDNIYLLYARIQHEKSQTIIYYKQKIIDANTADKLIKKLETETRDFMRSINYYYDLAIKPKK